MPNTPLLPPPLPTAAAVLVMVAVNLEKYKPQRKNYLFFTTTLTLIPKW